jgi:hypothetical protein
LVESGDVVNDLAGDQDPIPGRLISNRDSVDKLGCIGNTDLHTNSACGEFAEEGMKTAAVFVTAPCHGTVPDHQQTQHHTMIIGLDDTEALGT